RQRPTALLVQFCAECSNRATALREPLTIAEHVLKERLQTGLGIRVAVPHLARFPIVAEVMFDQGLADRLLRLEKVVDRAQGYLSLLGNISQGGVMKALLVYQGHRRLDQPLTFVGLSWRHRAFSTSCR